MKHKKATKTQKITVLIVLAAIVSLSIMGRQGKQPVNTEVHEYYRYYTIVRYNGNVDEIYVDTDVYNIGCDGWDDDNEEGHNCVLLGRDSIDEFMNYVR